MQELSIVKKKFIDYIDKIIEYKRVSHAYLIEIDNDKDMIYIYDFIKMILCDCLYQKIDKNNNIVKLIDNNNYPDIKIIEPDGNWIKKTQLLELQKEYNNKSLLGKKRIYIINKAERLNSSSANTMLKFLEEPEEDIIALLITDNRYHVLDTILSRCQILNLKEDIYNIEKEDEIMDLIECFINPNNFFLQYNYLMNKEIVDKTIFKEKLQKIEHIFINYLNCKFEKSLEKAEEDLNVLLKKCDDKDIIKYISIIEEEIPKLEFNVNFKLWLDSFFSKLVGGSCDD
ncbi:MAG: hypothetical protein HFJ11_01685 [Bacilli bacterium]|nr:hypothetical protein [Bacilli bacterium]